MIELGCDIDPEKINTGGKKLRPDELLFGESQSRVIVSCKPENVQAVIEEARRHGIDVSVIGKVTDDGRIRIGKLIDVKTSEVLDGYNNSIKRQME